MYLEGSLTKTINNPTIKQIEDALNAFDTDNFDEFLILSKNEMTYIQTAISEYQDEGFIIEYQDGSLEKHYVSVDRNITKDSVLEAFTSYLSGTETWYSKFEWEPLKSEEEELD